MFTSPSFILRYVAAVLLAVAAGPVFAAPGDAPALKYAWKNGDEHAFKVTITIDSDDEVETHTGTPSYRVTAADDGNMKLSFSGGLSKSIKPKAAAVGAFPRFPIPTPPRFPEPGQGRTLTINERGKVITEEGEAQLPYLLGDLAMLPLLPLPKTADKTWTISRETNISITKSTGFRHPFFDRERKNVKAEEESVYAISKTEGDVVTIKESYTLEALEQVKGKPSMEMIGDGTFTFDTKLGGPTGYESKISLVLREGNTTTEVPITVSIKRVDTAELEAMRTAATEALARSKAEADAEMRKPIEPVEMTNLIDDLNGDNKDKAKRALDRIAKKIPVAPDTKVASAIERHVTSDDFWVRKSALAAMEKWSTKESVPALLEGLKDKDVFNRASAMNAIAQYPSKEVAQALAALLDDGFSRGKAVELLSKMGDLAEDAAIERLTSKEWVTQMETCKVLAAVGGEKSLKALAPLTSDGNGLVKLEANKAVEAIKKRMAEKK